MTSPAGCHLSAAFLAAHQHPDGNVPAAQPRECFFHDQVQKALFAAHASTDWFEQLAPLNLSNIQHCLQASALHQVGILGR